VEVDRSTSTLYIHGLNIRGTADTNRLRKDVQETEAALIRIMGSADEITALRDHDRQVRKPLEEHS
jgi:multicomponent Na+:H+ antiporter subunit E